MVERRERSGKIVRFLAPCMGLALLGLVVPSCSVGEGHGAADGTLSVPDCWSGKFAFRPDFFAGIPYRETLDIRLQEGGDYTTFSDGLDILVRDVNAILPSATGAGRLGQPLPVRVSSEVTPPGVPVERDPSPALVEISLYLQRTCKIQNVALYAGTVSLNADGACDAVDAPVTPCPATTAAATAQTQNPPIAESKITFTHLFNGVADEEDAAKRLTEASFDLYMADPREICPGGFGPPPRCRGHLTGDFSFYFERGRPAQRFP